MTRAHPWTRRFAVASLSVVVSAACLTSTLPAQQGGDRTPRGDSLRQAQRLDIYGKHG